MSKIEKQRLRISNIKHIFTHILEGNNKNTFRYDENEIAKFGDNNTYKYMNMILNFIENNKEVTFNDIQEYMKLKEACTNNETMKIIKRLFSNHNICYGSSIEKIILNKKED